MADALAQLEAEYCPPLDPALLSAILSDYDLDAADGLRDARLILDQLKESAQFEEAAGFDPSGTGAQDDLHERAQRAESCPETSPSTSNETDLTSLSNGVSSLDLEHGDEHVGNADLESLENLDDETKVQLLQEIFGDRVSKYSVQYTLKKCNGRWQAAMEELLNHVYFEEGEHSDENGKITSKGIDAFFEDDAANRGRKSKGKSNPKRAKVMLEQRASSLDSSPSPATNRWQSATDDIEFIASRTHVPYATISSTYASRGSSLPQTISALLKSSLEDDKAVVTNDPTIAMVARELGHDFPAIAPEYIAALMRLTHPSFPAARELAEALAKPPRTTYNGGIQIIPQYTPPQLSDDEGPARIHYPGNTTASSGNTSNTNYALARATAFSQASAAHRRAKSDRLMGGAAAYYSQLGRENALLSSRANAAAADRLVATQSSRTQLDLHGVGVVDAVRISQERVEAWWAGLGESRSNGRLGAEDRSAGFSIVVGLGRHSEGGKGKLGPAVGKALKAGGWRIEAAGAVILVRGRVGKR